MSKEPAGEQGSALLLGLLFVVAILALGALTIDAPLQARRGLTLQRGIDAAALASALQLNQQQKGWRAARRAALAFLEKNGVLASSGRGSSGCTDTFESESEIQGLTFGSSDGRITVTVERGYFLRSSGADPKFYSLECREFCDPSSGELTDLTTVCAGSPPTFQVANAVRITAREAGGQTLFARINNIGVREMGILTRVSVAAPT